MEISQHFVEESQKHYVLKEAFIPYLNVLYNYFFLNVNLSGFGYWKAVRIFI